MNKSTHNAILLAIILLVSFHHSYAADSTSNKSPIAVLVQLRTEHNRIQAMTAAKKFENVNEVKKDAAGVTNAMINDFRDHFTFCPVYYFVDTNLDLIKQKHFDGILMNADETPAKNPALNDADKMYLVVYYGYPVAQSRRTATVTQPDNYQNDSGEPMGRGLIINNRDYEQVSFLYKFGYNSLFSGRKKSKYTYTSKHYDMEYFPFAKEFNKKLQDRKDKIRITHVNGF